MNGSVGVGTWAHARRTTAARRRSARRLCRASCAGCLVVAGIAMATEPAVAGTYPMRNCNVPGQAAAPMGPWRPAPAPTTVLVDNCSAGGGFDFTLPWAKTMGLMTDATLNLERPTDEARRSIALDRLRVWTKTQFTGTGALLSAVGSTASTTGSFMFGLQADGSSAGPVSDFDVPPRTTAVRLLLHCGVPDYPARAAPRAESDCTADSDVPLEVRGIELTLREDVAPAGSAVGGTLLGDKPVSAIRSLDYTALDAASGIARVEAVIGETVAATRDLAGRCSYADWSACPTVDRGTLTVDTRNVPDGRYALSLRMIDAAGNQHDAAIQSIEIKNQVSPPSLEIGLQPPAVAHLTASFASTSRSSLIVPFGRRVRVRGRLTGAARSGLAGAQIDVFERAAKAGANEVSVGSVRTRYERDVLVHAGERATLSNDPTGVWLGG